MSDDTLQGYDFGDWFEKVTVSFFIRSESTSMKPTEISTLLGIEASRSFTKGDSYLGKTLDPITKRKHEILRQRPVSIWEITTEGKISSNKVSDHVAYLLDSLEPSEKHLDYYLSNRDIFTVVVRVDVSWKWDDKDIVATGYSLESKLLNRLASICHYVEYNSEKF
jgi:hypothetical protein